MTQWLASVKSLSEAQSLTDTLPDILDMKNPAQGALGALSSEEVAEIVSWIEGRCLTSATVGDLPMQSKLIAEAIDQMATTGVDYVKVGLFADENLLRCIEQLQDVLAKQTTPVIAVLFADQPVEAIEQMLELLKQVGFAGVMLDTASKDGQGLLKHWTIKDIEHFVELTQRLKLLSGLAGALKVEEIDILRDLEPDYLGFRSALCDERQRTKQLQPALAKQIQYRLHKKTALAS